LAAASFKYNTRSSEWLQNVHRAKSSLKARHRGKQIPAGERLLHKRRIAVRRRKMLAAIAADKGKGYAARDQGIGYAARRLAGEMGV
jgi:hypothetical protein